MTGKGTSGGHKSSGRTGAGGSKSQRESAPKGVEKKVAKQPIKAIKEKVLAAKEKAAAKKAEKKASHDARKEARDERDLRIHPCPDWPGMKGPKDTLLRLESVGQLSSGSYSAMLTIYQIT